MFIRKTVKRYKVRTYTNYLLVEAVSTPQGPRQKTICSLGDLSPGPPRKWQSLVGRVEAALQGQASLEDADPLVDTIVGRVRSAGERLSQRVGDVVAVHTDQVRVERQLRATAEHVSANVAAPWFAENIRPYLAGPAQRSVGEVIAGELAGG